MGVQIASWKRRNPWTTSETDRLTARGLLLDGGARGQTGAGPPVTEHWSSREGLRWLRESSLRHEPPRVDEGVIETLLR
jgi:hypothetical protein